MPLYASGHRGRIADDAVESVRLVYSETEAQARLGEGEYIKTVTRREWRRWVGWDLLPGQFTEVELRRKDGQ